LACVLLLAPAASFAQPAPDAPASESRPLVSPSAKPKAQNESERTAEPAGAGARWSDTLAVMGPLALVLGLIFAGAGVIRKAAVRRESLAAALGPGGRAPSGLLEIIGRYPVARGQMLVLLKLDRRVLLLGHSAPSRGASGGFQTLAEITDPEHVAAILLKARDAEGESAARQFGEVLASLEQPEPPADEHEHRRVVGGAGGDRAVLWRDDPASIPPFTHAGAEPGPTLRDRLSALRGRAAINGGRTP
jgi:flagellar biogenesis protein FliO